jgi:predicted HTH transcriptional regulator
MIYADRDRAESEGADIGVRIAVYPDTGVPEILEAAASTFRAATDKFSRLVCDKVRELGGPVPEEAIREVVENLVHAEYKGVVISIFDGGRSVRVSDKGSGVEHKERAFEFGFTSATAAMGDIRGVGAGLGIARAAVRGVGGTVTIEDNMGGGTVTTISVPHSVEEDEAGSEPETLQPRSPQRRYPDAVPRMEISGRQEKVLLTVLEYGEVGPSTVADHLEISVSTAYRDLSLLQEQGLLNGDETGKRMISPLGRDLVAAIIQNWVQ